MLLNIWDTILRLTEPKSILKYTFSLPGTQRRSASYDWDVHLKINQNSNWWNHTCLFHTLDGFLFKKFVRISKYNACRHIVQWPIIVGKWMALNFKSVWKLSSSGQYSVKLIKFWTLIIFRTWLIPDKLTSLRDAIS